MRSSIGRASKSFWHRSLIQTEHAQLMNEKGSLIFRYRSRQRTIWKSSGESVIPNTVSTLILETRKRLSNSLWSKPRTSLLRLPKPKYTVPCTISKTRGCIPLPQRACSLAPLISPDTKCVAPVLSCPTRKQDRPGRDLSEQIFYGLMTPFLTWAEERFICALNRRQKMRNAECGLRNHQTAVRNRINPFGLHSAIRNPHFLPTDSWD